MHETLAAGLSKSSLRLLVAVWMAGGSGVELSRRELEVRAGLSHNSLDLARIQLEDRGVLTVTRGNGGKNVYTLHVGTTPAPAPTPAPRDDTAEVIAAFKRWFPEEARRYPLTRDNARRLLGLADVKRVLSLFEQVSSKQGVKYPKAYVEKMLKERIDEEGPEDAPEEVVALIRKGQNRERLFN